MLALIRCVIFLGICVAPSSSVDHVSELYYLERLWRALSLAELGPLDAFEIRCAGRQQDSSLADYVLRDGLPQDDAKLLPPCKERVSDLALHKGNVSKYLLRRASNIRSLAILEPDPDQALASKASVPRPERFEYGEDVVRSLCGGSESRWRLTQIDFPQIRSRFIPPEKKNDNGGKGAVRVVHDVDLVELTSAVRGMGDAVLDLVALDGRFIVATDPDYTNRAKLLQSLFQALRPAGMLSSIGSGEQRLVPWTTDFAPEAKLRRDLGDYVFQNVRHASVVSAKAVPNWGDAVTTLQSRATVPSKVEVQDEVGLRPHVWIRHHTALSLLRLALTRGGAAQLLRIIAQHSYLHPSMRHLGFERLTFAPCFDGRPIFRLLNASYKDMPSLLGGDSGGKACGAATDNAIREAMSEYISSVSFLGGVHGDDPIWKETSAAILLGASTCFMAVANFLGRATAGIMTSMLRHNETTIVWDSLSTPADQASSGLHLDQMHWLGLEAILKQARWSRRLQRRLSFWEVGVHEGVVSRHLLSKLPWLQVDAVDTWSRLASWAHVEDYATTEQSQWAVYGAASKRLAAFGSRARVWRMDSVTAAASVASSRDHLDVVFIDASHIFCNVMIDLEAWAPLVERSCGILAGHDWTWGFNSAQGAEVAVAVTVWRSFVSAMQNRSLPPVKVGIGGLWWIDFSSTCA